MGRIKARRPSPSMVVALAALVVAVVGTAIATPLVTKSVLNKKEKKQVKNIAANQIKSLAPGLSVASARTANSAATATNSTNAATATNAGNAANADALGGVALADLVQIANGADASCDATGDFTTPCDGVTLMTRRTADLFVIVSGTWHSDDTGVAVQADCRIEHNGSLTGQVNPFGATSGDTTSETQGATLVITHLEEDRPPGTHTYRLSCDENLGDFDTLDLETTVAVLGS